MEKVIGKIKSFLLGLNKKQRLILTATGIALAFALIVFLVLYHNGYSGVHNYSGADEGQIKVACVGDSITYGHGISSWSKNNYPAVLQDILGDKYHVQNFGHSGATASDEGDQPYTKTSEYKKSLEYDADILVIMLGTNDSKPENWVSANDFRSRYDSLIESYKKNNPDLRVIVCTPACAFFSNGKTSGTTNYDIQPSVVTEIYYFLRTYAVSSSYELVDIYDITKNHAEWFEDNIHPSADGARAIAEAVAKKIR